MQLHKVLCNVYTYDMIFIIQFLKSTHNCIKPQCQSPSPRLKIVGAHQLTPTCFIVLYGNLIFDLGFLIYTNSFRNKQGLGVS